MSELSEKCVCIASADSLRKCKMSESEISGGQFYRWMHVVQSAVLLL